MIKRIVAVTKPAFLRLKHDQLVLEHDNQELGRIPCEDIGVLVLENQQIVITKQAMSRCLEVGAAVLLCDERHMPSCALQPFDANSLHAKVLRRQTRISSAAARRAWKQIVAQKILHQGQALERLQLDGAHLLALAKRVKPGDESNIEAQAARVYWQRLFGPEFRRRSNGDGVNSLLNYGYAVVRACVARAISATGLHPALGIHHTNQYNAFALADDLMEPFRPMVDTEVFAIAKATEFPIELSPEIKQRLWGISAKDCIIGERQLPLMVALQGYVSSVRRNLFREEKTIAFPVP